MLLAKNILHGIFSLSCNLQVDFIGHCQLNTFGNGFLYFIKSWRVQGDISLTVIIALIVSYIIAHFVTFAYFNAVCLLYYLRHGNA